MQKPDQSTRFVDGIEVKEITGYEGRYAVSQDGRVFSFAKFAGNGNYSPRPIAERWLRPAENLGGYMAVVLAKNGSRKTIKIARLVAMTWLPNPNGFLVVNHLNGNKQDDRVENLEWCTHSRNNKHAWDAGLKQPISVERKAAMRQLGLASRKLSIEQVEEVKKLASNGWLQRDIGAHFGVCQSVISRLLAGDTYRKSDPVNA